MSSVLNNPITDKLTNTMTDKEVDKIANMIGKLEDPVTYNTTKTHEWYAIRYQSRKIWLAGLTKEQADRLVKNGLTPDSAEIVKTTQTIVETWTPWELA